MRRFLQKRGRRGQASAEYLMITALALVLIVPMIFVFYSRSIDSIQTITINQVRDYGQDIIDNAEIVYYQGVPARITIEQNFPEGLKSMYIEANGKILVIEFVDGQQLAFTSKVIIKNGLTNEKFDQTAVAPGKKNIRLDAQKGASPDLDYVLITIS